MLIFDVIVFDWVDWVLNKGTTSTEVQGRTWGGQLLKVQGVFYKKQ